jgi:hypothetical protein
LINKIEFSARNLTSNAGLFLLLDHASKNGIFDLIDDLVLRTIDQQNQNEPHQDHALRQLHWN